MGGEKRTGPRTWPYTGIFFFFWLGSNILIPYLGLFYEGRGFSSETIGFLSGLFQFMTVAAALAGGYLVDTLGNPGRIVALLTLGMIASSLLLYASGSFVLAAAAVVLLSFCYAPVNGITDRVAMEAMRDMPGRYAASRSGGTLGAGAGILIASALIRGDDFFPVILGFIAAVLPCILCGLRFEGGRETKVTRPQIGDYRALFGSRYFFPIYGALAAWGLAESGVGTFLALLVKGVGYPVTLTSVIVVCAMTGEFISFQLASRLVQRFAAVPILTAAFAVQVLRIGSLALLGILPLPVVLFLQFTGGSSFAMVHSVTTLLVDQLFPEETLYTAHSLKRVMTNGVGNTVGLLLSGFLFARGAGRPGYWLLDGGVIFFVFYFLLHGNLFEKKR